MWMISTGVALSTVPQTRADSGYGLTSAALVVIWPIS
jgi:hypothetical protein